MGQSDICGSQRVVDVGGGDTEAATSLVYALQWRLLSGACGLILLPRSGKSLASTR